MYAYYIICILIKWQKNAPQPNPPPLTPAFTTAQLLGFFLRLLPRRAFLHLPALQDLTFYERLFTPMVTLWYLLFQWLNADHTLDAVLTDAHAGGADRLNGKLSRRLRSHATTSYSDARQKLPTDLLAQALRWQGGQIIDLSPTALWQGLVLTLLDGSTVRLRPSGDIAKTFPPHGNQHRRRAYWCLIRVVVGFCALTGAALDCALGSTGLSEQALGVEIILRATSRCLFIGDRNFGVFWIAQVARHSDQHVLLRLTKQRARKLLGKSLKRGDYAVNWTATRHAHTQAGLSTEPVPGRLIVVPITRPGFRSQPLYLFTTLQDPLQYPVAELVRLYGLRWHIELNLRYVKAQMEAAQLHAHSAEMARKEWLAALMAYNLIRAAMLCAALSKGVPALSLSFSACRRRLEYWLRNLGRSRAAILQSWKTILQKLSCCRLPCRRKARPSEPRAQRHLRESFPPLIGSRAKARKKLQNAARKS